MNLRPVLMFAFVLLVASAAADKSLFSAEVYLGHVRRLADDDLGGRGPGTPGIEQAAEYIAAQFRAAGLEPAGDDRTYFQAFQVNRRRLEPDAARFEMNGIDRGWRVGHDWTPLAESVPEDFEGPAAFAGYGIEAPQHDYNDYDEGSGFDPAGKVLLVLRYEPRAEDPTAAFGGREPSSNALFMRKARWAASRGAKALLIVDPPMTRRRSAHAAEPSSRPARAAGGLRPFLIADTATQYDLPIVQVSASVAEALLRAAGMRDLLTITEELDETRKPMSRDLEGVRVRVRQGLEPVVTRNVLGLLRGEGGDDEIVVVGAHYDHLGLARPRTGDSDEPQIHNGADDNASGTAGIIELAAAFAQSTRPRRSLLFIAFSAEEMGLLGSRHFVKFPTVALDRIRFMYNLDMIGRYRPERFEIFGVDSASELPELVERVAAQAGVSYQAVALGGRGASASDHASFRRAGIPVLFPSTNLHDDYHKPTDDWELINGEGAVQVLDVSYRLVREIAQMPAGPAFVEAPEARRSARRDPTEAGDDDARPARPARDGRAEPPPADPPASQPAADPHAAASTPPRSDADPPQPRMPAVRLGIAPDYGDPGPGLRIDSVASGGAAEKAGIKSGDRILSIGDAEIRTIEDYMSVLGGFKPGDEVVIVVRRADENLALSVKLAAPQEPRRPDR